MQTSRGALACVLLSLTGLGLCIYLGYLHIGLLRGELLGGSVCGGVGSLFNCHAVTGGPLGSAFGLPLWIWGLVGYLATLNLASIAWLFPDWAVRSLTLVTGLALAFIAVDAALLTAMVTQIRHLCLFCLLTYAVNLSLLVFGKQGVAQPWGRLLGQLGQSAGAFLPSRQRPLAWMFWGVMVLGSAGGVGLHVATTFVSLGSPALIRKQLRDFVAKETRVSADTTGDPAEGPSSAPLEMVEFSDFFCPVCQRAWQFNAIILANHRKDIRFVFKHFPLDTSCNEAIGHSLHPGACNVAAASECAHLQGKFWPFHDRVFALGHDYNMTHVADDAKALGLDVARFQACLGSGEGMEAVRRDIREGKRLGVMSTPTYVVNGLKLSGVMTPAMVEELATVLRDTEGQGVGRSGS